MALTIANVRTYTKDMPEYNVLLQGNPQSSDALIALAIKLTVNDFNMTPPVMAYTVNTFPEEADGFAMYGILMHLANSEAERQLRNQVDYALQGLTTQIDNKFSQYNQLAQYYRGLFEQQMGQYKVYLNQSDAWGGVWSPLAAINEYRYRT